MTLNLRATLVAALVFLLSSCATTGDYEKVLNSWIGSDISRLIESWGPPTDTYRMPDGRTLYTWFFDGGAVAMPFGNMAYAVSRSCKTTFTVGTNGVVQTWRYEGNAC
jgi:hypothetical protein